MEILAGSSVEPVDITSNPRRSRLCAAYAVFYTASGISREGRRIAAAGIYDLRIHHDQVLVPVLKHWQLSELHGLSDAVEEARRAALALCVPTSVPLPALVFVAAHLGFAGTQVVSSIWIDKLSPAYD